MKKHGHEQRQKRRETLGSDGSSGKGTDSQHSDNSRLSPLVLSNPVNQSADWSQESYQLPDLVTVFPLPRVVRCASRLIPGEDTRLPVNVHVPMLLFPGRLNTKLLARHVGLDSRSQNPAETEDTIVIPSDFDGHFLRLQARTTKDKSMVRTLQHIANNSVPAFINLTPLVSYGLDESTNSKRNSKGHALSQTKLLHPPGSVFVVSGTTKGWTRVNRKTKECTLLKCTKQDSKGVFIPTNQVGEFLEVQTPANGITKLSVLPKDLISTNRYPQLVRYVYGDHAPRLSPCSMMFTLIDTFEEDSVIGCLLYPDHAVMIELPMTSSLNFQVAMNHEDMMAMPLPQLAMNEIQNKREVFLKDLKLKCKFFHQVSSGFGHPVGLAAGRFDEDMPSVTMRAKHFASEAFIYL